MFEVNLRKCEKTSVEIAHGQVNNPNTQNGTNSTSMAYTKVPGKYPGVLSRNTLIVTNLHSTITTRTPRRESLHNHKPAIAGHLHGEGAAWVRAGFPVAREGGDGGVGAGLEGGAAPLVPG